MPPRSEDNGHVRVADEDTNHGLTPEARRRLLVEFNDTTAPYPQLCLHQLVAERSRLVPERVAVRCGGAELTFAQLERQAHQLAHHLMHLGVGPESLVGVCLERSVEMLVSLLGVLHAGGAYVPIDPAFPAERQAYMLDDSAAPVLITSASLAEGLDRPALAVVKVDADRPAIAQRPSEAPTVVSSPDQLAYVMYTSGSTGRPKGVQITHRALVNFLTTMSRARVSRSTTCWWR